MSEVISDHIQQGTILQIYEQDDGAIVFYKQENQVYLDLNDESKLSVESEINHVSPTSRILVGYVEHTDVTDVFISDKHIQRPEYKASIISLEDGKKTMV